MVLSGVVEDGDSLPAGLFLAGFYPHDWHRGLNPRFACLKVKIRTGTKMHDLQQVLKFSLDGG